MSSSLLDREREIWNAHARQTLGDAATVERVLPGFDEWERSKRQYREITGFLRDNPLKHLPAFQIGAGDVFHVILPDIGYHDIVIGDLADAALDVARMRNAHNPKPAQYAYHEVDAHRLPFADGSLGLVIANSVLHHLDRRRFLPELQRVLAPGGRAVFIDGHMEGAIRLFLQLRKFRSVDRGSDNPLTPEDIRELHSRFTTRIVRTGFLSMMVPYLAYGWLPLTKERKIGLNNRLTSVDIWGARNVPGLRMLCGVSLLMLEKAP